jgi:hypothetical protein
MKPTGETLHPVDDTHVAHTPPDPGQWDKWGWGKLKGVDSCCNETQGTYAPYIEPEIVYMDSLYPEGSDCD